ncbi:MAG TPA: M23 family metallopeptidase [Acidimicrobiales bacterium]|nr:M23 family metallopeptidase [Acidimicrobiales bacterium]
MVRIPGWVACLAVFAMISGSGVDAADAADAAMLSAGLAGMSTAVTSTADTGTVDVIDVAIDVYVVFSQPDVLPLIELIEVVAPFMPAAVVVPPAPVWLCPISSAVRFGDTYGEGRSGGWRHLGVDMTAPLGTPTVAPVSGSVRYTRDSAGGLSWHLDGEDGNYYYGTHLSRYGSVTGHVDAGTVIGYVGQSGNASMPHLHLEIRPGGISKPSINPTPMTTKACNNTLPR